MPDGGVRMFLGSLDTRIRWTCGDAEEGFKINQAETYIFNQQKERVTHLYTIERLNRSVQSGHDVLTPRELRLVLPLSRGQLSRLEARECHDGGAHAHLLLQVGRYLFHPLVNGGLLRSNVLELFN